jgi:hypothetical protein
VEDSGLCKVYFNETTPLFWCPTSRKFVVEGNIKLKSLSCVKQEEVKMSYKPAAISESAVIDNDSSCEIIEV